MRFKSLTWFLLSLLLFAATLWMGFYAEKYSAAHRRAATPTTPVHPPPPRAPALTKAANQTQTGKPDSYRLSNTRATAGQLARNNHGLILRNALIDTALPVRLKIPAHLRAQGAPGSYIVQSDRPLDREFYAELTKNGATYVGYIPNNAALVQATPEQAKQMVQDPAFQAVLPYEPYYKLDATLLPSAVEQEPQTNALRVTTFPGQRDAAVAALTGLGASVIGEDRGPFGPILIVQAPPDTLAAVAQLPLAQEIEVYGPRHSANDLARVQLGVSADTLTNTPNYLNLTGSNIWVNINDTGVDASHPDLSNRVSGVQYDYDGHGTHVAGILAGSGLKSATVTNYVPGSIIPGADFRGKAPGAQLYVQGLDLLLGPFISDAYLQSNASSALITDATASHSGITNGFISNNSWNYQGMAYDMAAASYDAAVRDAQPATPGEQAMLFVFAAGNSGDGSGSGTDGLEGTITSPGTAKNVITVGSINSPRFITNQVDYNWPQTNSTSNAVFYGTTDNSNLVSFFSSCGNVGIQSEGQFGRFKPDVVAPGVFTVSCRAADYVDPTLEYILDYINLPAQIVNPGKTNILPIILPVDSVSLTVQLVANLQSPSPFPPLLIQNGRNNPPGGAESTSPMTTANNLVPGYWYVAIINPTNQPVSYDLNIYIYQTNTLGNYYTVLSNMNHTLGPYYRYENGTSMSAAAVSGVLALMQQFLQTNFPANPNPSPALLKALLINGARSLGGVYDFNMQSSVANEQGWGLVNLQNSIPASMTNASSSSLWFTDQSPANALSTGQYRTYTINTNDVNMANFPLRVTLVWTDPPGNPAAGIALVNNLDLTVTDNSGTNVYVGNDFLAGDTFTESSSSTNPAPSDFVNNVENVYISTDFQPISFPLTIKVNATRVNVDAVTTQTNQIEQDFALVVSSDDTAPAGSLVVTTNGITNVLTPLITVVRSGQPLLHQRVGANEPNLYNYAAGATNGGTNQWHFFIFTNDQLFGSNILLTTFYPPNLSRPRNTDADIDLYASTDPGLLSLTPAALAGARTSLGRGGNEFIYYSNQPPNMVYFIGVKSEDQQAADFGFYAVAQSNAFSSVNSQTGDVTYYGSPIPAVIPDGSYDFPGQVTVIVAFEGAYAVRKVVVANGVAHQNPGDLAGTLMHPPSPATVFLNNHSGTAPGFTNTYDDMPENPLAVLTPSDGPGSLQDFIGQQAAGEWQLSEVDNAQGGVGTVTALSVTVSPKPPFDGPITVALAANGGSYFNYVDVPNDAIYLTNVVIFESQTSGGPIGIYMTNALPVSTGDFGSNGIVPPGGYLLLGTNNIPPLTGGRWYYGLYNFGSLAVTLTNYIFFRENLTPNLVESFSNNTVTPLTTDGTTASQICVTSGQQPVGQQLVDLQVGLRIADTNLDNLVLHLTSPQGTSVLLFENRGGTNASNLGMTLLSTNAANSNLVSTNIVYTVFTENTNLATVPIKFAPPPYASTNFITGSNFIAYTGFEANTNGTYTNGQVVGGWTVVTNRVGIVSHANFAHAGSNFLALTTGRIVQTFTTMPGASYELQYFVRSPQITDWWPGDNNAEDILNGNNGTLSPSGASYATGMVGQAFRFDGTNGYVQVPDSPILKPANVTVEAWVLLDPNLPSNNGGEQIVFKKNTWSAWFEGYSLNKETIDNGDGTSSDRFQFVVSRYGDQVVINSQTIARRGVWYHVAATYDGNQSILYVNGVAEASATPGFALDYDTTPLFIGTTGTWVPYLNMFGGLIDETSLYNRALSPAEIRAICNAGSRGKYSTNSLLPNFQLSIDGVATNTVILTNFAGPWEGLTNSFTATNSQTTIELAGNPLSVLFDDIQLVELPNTNYNNYYLAEEPLTPFIGENPQGCWTLQIWDTRSDSPLPNNGALLSWDLQMTISSTNVSLVVLTNGVPYTNAPGGTYTNITYFGVDVPATANFATNILTVTGGTNQLNLLFNQSALPTGGLPGDMTLLAGVTAANGPGTNTLSTQGAPPPLLPGRRYFLGVQNNASVNVPYTLEVNFDVASNNIIPLTNGAFFATNIGNTGPQYYSFVVPGNASMVTFQILNTTNAELDLFARDGLPVPGPLNFDYDSRNAGTNDQFIVVTTNSVPVPLPTATTNEVLPPAPTTWYLAVYNFAGVANAGYTILATYVTNGAMLVIPLTDGVGYATNQVPGFPTNLVYSFTVANNPAGVEFTVTNTGGQANAQLLVGDGTFPTPANSYSGSFNPGTELQFVAIGTNASAPSLDGIWYLAVPNTGSNEVKYTITAVTVTNRIVISAPLFLAARITSPTNGFTMYWSANPGQSYAIDVSTNLTHWALVTNITASSTTASYTDAVPVQSQKARFFRLSTP
ncbi:MAG: S8 family serine peptidase [Verrucomicrobiota bacterium]|jgi:subtilisin-like proprotein convertase family protein